MKELRLDASAWKFITDELAAPFEAHEVKFRPGGKGTSLAYTDARTYQDRLDFVVGAQNWTITHKPVELTDLDAVDVTAQRNPDAPRWEPGGKFKNPIYDYEERHYGGIETSVVIFGIAKQDVGKASNVDQLKGAYSDGLKRAGTLWGIGKYFYFVGDKHKSVSTFPDWAQPKSRPDFDAVINKMMADEAVKSHPDFDLVTDGWVEGLPLVYARQIILELRKLKAGK